MLHGAIHGFSNFLIGFRQVSASRYAPFFPAGPRRNNITLSTHLSLSLSAETALDCESCRPSWQLGDTIFYPPLSPRRACHLFWAHFILSTFSSRYGNARRARATNYIPPTVACAKLSSTRHSIQHHLFPFIIRETKSFDVSLFAVESPCILRVSGTHRALPPPPLNVPQSSLAISLFIVSDYPRVAAAYFQNKSYNGVVSELFRESRNSAGSTVALLYFSNCSSPVRQSPHCKVYVINY